MRIVHVNAERGFSGGEVQLFHLVNGLLAAGVAQTLIARPGSRAIAAANERFPDALKAGQLQVVAIEQRNNADLLAIGQLRATFKRLHAQGPLVIHLHTGRATWLGAWAARGLRVPVVSTRRMDRTVKPGWGTRTLYTKLVDRVVAISGPIAEQLKIAGVPAERIRVIHSSVDASALRADPEMRARVRAEFGLGEDAFVLLVLARLDRRKGIDVLLKSMIRVRNEAGLDSLRKRNSRAAAASRKGVAIPMSAAMPASSPLPTLLIAGEGPERAALEKAASVDQLKESIHFLGARPDKLALLSACDALVLPSRQEGLGVAALEAMAAGRAVIATRVGGLGEAVVDGETGLLADPDDERTLSQAVLRLARDPDLVKRLGRGGPLRIAEAYDVKKMVAAYQALYADLLGA